MADPRKLDERDLGHLKLAGDWKLLRDMSGWKVCMTGKMSMERSQLAALVEAAGGQFTNSMSNSVRLLIVADDATWTTKLEKAEEAGTRVMRESEFAAELLPTPAELLSGARAAFGQAR
jgi:NAD-dependent DNA ligase